MERRDDHFLDFLRDFLREHSELTLFADEKGGKAERRKEGMQETKKEGNVYRRRW